MTKKKRLGYTLAAKKLVGQMTLEEKVSLMSGEIFVQDLAKAKKAGYHFNYFPYKAGGNEKFHVPALKFCDGSRGVVCKVGENTCFPVPLLRGAAFDKRLETQIGHAIGREVLASGGNFFGGVCINLPYHPGWGRSQESYGEDSFAIGALGSALVKGIQEEGVIACLKHYAFNSMEDGRFKVSVDCSPRAEREIFLAHFKECIDVGAAGVMTAYNRFRGILCGHSEYLLRRVLKEEWDFDGIVISDFFWGVKNTAKAALAGVDVEMCHTLYYGEKLVNAVQAGLVGEAVIDEAAIRIVRTLLSFQDVAEQRKNEKGQWTADSKKHIRLALRCAQEGIVLIKNDNHVLPFKKSLKRIAVIGRLASVENTGDWGSSRVYPSHVVTPLEGIVKEMPKAQILYYNGEDTAHAALLAKEADAVIFIAGLDYRDEGEYDPLKENSVLNEAKGGDRKSLGLHPQETALLKKAGDLNPMTAVVLMGGSTILVTDWEKSVPAILYAGYPGQEGGTAIAQILFGRINPSGKLPFVLPEKESDLPKIHWDGEEQYYGYDFGSSYLEKRGIKPFRPYGFGMSYTDFELSGVEIGASSGRFFASAMVKNKGAVSGTEVLQLYAGFKQSRVERPCKKLCGFERISLRPGETKKAVISCPIEKLKYYDPREQCFKLEHMEYEVYIGTSRGDEDLYSGRILLPLPGNRK